MPGSIILEPESRYRGARICFAVLSLGYPVYGGEEGNFECFAGGGTLGLLN